MSEIRKIRRNKSELAGVGRCNKYGSPNTPTFKSKKDLINSTMQGFAKNDLPENHNGNIQKQVIKMLNEGIAHLD